MIDILNTVRTYMTKRDSIAAHTNNMNNPLFAPEHAKRRPVTELATAMDVATHQIMAEFPPMSPVEWEAFLELLPNVRKILGMSDGWS